MIRKLAIISDCTRECPYVKIKDTIGAGCADDFLCGHPKTKPSKKQTYHKEVGRLIAGYVEWSRERPKAGVFPKWCPLQTAEEGMYIES